MEEARYLLSKLIGMTLNSATLAAQREASNKELQSQVKQVLERDAVHQQLLQHVLANSDLEVYNLLASGTTGLAGLEGAGSGSSQHSRSRSSSPAESVATTATITSTNRSSKIVSKKARRLTFATPEDLLYSDGSLPPPEMALLVPEVTVSRSPKYEF